MRAQVVRNIDVNMMLKKSIGMGSPAPTPKHQTKILHNIFFSAFGCLLKAFHLLHIHGRCYYKNSMYSEFITFGYIYSNTFFNTMNIAFRSFSFIRRAQLLEQQ